MSFKVKKASKNAILYDVVIDNSDTVQIGDAVKALNGNLEVVTAGDPVAGIVVDLVDKNGDSIFGSIAKVGSATVSGTPAAGSGQVVVASNNETVDLIAARIDMSKETIYSATVDGTINTTTASAKLGGWIDATDKNSVNETTHTRTAATGGQFKGWGTDPDDSTRLLVSINESEVFDRGMYA